MSQRPGQTVVTFPARLPPGSARDAFDKGQAIHGKAVSFEQSTFLLAPAGHTVTDAAGGAGTALTVTRTMIDFGDAGVDSVRVVVRGKNSAAGAITVQIYDVTNSAILATATVTGTTEQTAIGAWTRIVPTGSDQELEVRVVGNAADDPILYAVHLQLRTVQTRV